MKKRTKLVFAANVSEAIFELHSQDQCSEFLKLLSKAAIKIQRKVLNLPKDSKVELLGIAGDVIAVPEGQDFNDLEADVMLFASFSNGKPEEEEADEEASEESENDDSEESDSDEETDEDSNKEKSSDSDDSDSETETEEEAKTEEEPEDSDKVDVSEESSNSDTSNKKKKKRNR